MGSVAKLLSRDRLRTLWYENTKVAENYVFMTLLQVLNMCFYLIIYPFLIRRLGAEGYGLYAYAWSMMAIVMAVVNFGFDLPNAKKVAEIVGTNIRGKKVLSEEQKAAIGDVLSCVQTAKTGVEIAVLAVYIVLLYYVPIMRDNNLIFSIAFIQTLTCILFPQWYFQGIQRMRVVTIVQVVAKVCSLPFIFVWVKTPADVWLFMLISSLTSVIGGMAAWLIIRYKDQIIIRFVHPARCRSYYREALPFFLTNAMGIVKEQGIVLLVGGFLGMANVAVYDLANKIVTVPRILLLQMNNALYPKVVVEQSSSAIKKIMRSEVVLSLIVVALLAATGRWIVLLFAGESLLGAYPVSVLLSLTILFWMLGTAYINFIFIPSGNSYLVTINQLISMVVCLSVSVIWLMTAPSVYAVVVGLVLSGLAEVVFCTIVTRRKHLLEVRGTWR